MFEVLTAGAVAGLISAPHCALMCGAIGVHARKCGPSGLLRYQTARALSYLLLGAGAGRIGEPLIKVLWSSKASLALSIALTFVLLAAAIRIWPRKARPVGDRAQPLIALRLRGSRSLFSRLLKHLPKSPAILGSCSALLPCGALWSGVALAVASGSAFSGAMLMLSFALVSGLGVTACSRLIPASSAAQPWRARITALVLAAGALVLLWRPLAMAHQFSTLEKGAVKKGETSARCPLHAKARH